MSRFRLEPVRGMRDLIPPESEEILWLQRVFTDVIRSYGYSAVITPTVELFKLFEMKSGPEISRSMYVFKDKAGREVCLRPEFTASVARIYLRLLMAEPKPIKLYYVGPAFRYEEPQRGRFREFIQAGVEFIGDDTPYSDIELILTVRDFYAAVGLRDYSIKMNSMAIYRKLFTMWGIPEGRQDLIIHYLDKGLLDEALRELKPFKGADPDLIKSLSGLKVRDPARLRELVKELRLPGELDGEVERLSKILDAVRSSGVGNAYIDLGFARGLAYYTGFIFEVLTPYLSFSIGGGGRYDTLISLYGGPQTPSTGYSLGIDRLHLALKEGGWSLPERVRKLLLISMVDDVGYVDRVAGRLRGLGLAVDVRFGRRLGPLLTYAVRKGFDYVGIVGSEEYGEGAVTIKNLSSREQRKLYVDSIDVGELP